MSIYIEYSMHLATCGCKNAIKYLRKEITLYYVYNYYCHRKNYERAILKCSN